MAAFFSYLHSTCIKFSKFIISALTFYLQADALANISVRKTEGFGNDFWLFCSDDYWLKSPDEMWLISPDANSAKYERKHYFGPCQVL